MNNLHLRLFTASWCGPCRALKPILEKISNEHNVKIEYVDIEENPEITQQYQIRSVPTLFFMKNDEIVEKINGLVPEAKLVELLSQYN